MATAGEYLTTLAGNGYVCVHGVQRYMVCPQCQLDARRMAREDVMMEAAVRLAEAVDRLAERLAAAG